MVSLYGTPAYEEIEPTAFLAITFLLMFGMMFGDLGQGMILAMSRLFHLPPDTSLYGLWHYPYGMWCQLHDLWPPLWQSLWS
ncbi:V-type ATPase 116kDa subunit family protein [Thermosulfuriphilus sp.]